MLAQVFEALFLKFFLAFFLTRWKVGLYGGKFFRGFCALLAARVQKSPDFLFAEACPGAVNYSVDLRYKVQGLGSGRETGLRKCPGGEFYLV